MHCCLRLDLPAPLHSLRGVCKGLEAKHVSKSGMIRSISTPTELKGYLCTTIVGGYNALLNCTAATATVLCGSTFIAIKSDAMTEFRVGEGAEIAGVGCHFIEHGAVFGDDTQWDVITKM